jgi:hypothetical protein
MGSIMGSQNIMGSDYGSNISACVIRYLFLKFFFERSSVLIQIMVHAINPENWELQSFRLFVNDVRAHTFCYFRSAVTCTPCVEAKQERSPIARKGRNLLC